MYNQTVFSYTIDVFRVIVHRAMKCQRSSIKRS